MLNWYLSQIGDRAVAIEVRADVRRVLSVRIRPTQVLPMYQVLAAIPDGFARFVMARLVERDRTAAPTRLLTEGMYDALEIVEEPFTPTVGGNQLVVLDPRRIVVIADDSPERR